ncbi:MAG TPA: isochorismate synthase [Polyangium sp.]|nr:isochorismate synthase [Polyangium sp.]
MNDSVSRWLDRLSRQATRGTTYALAIPADVVSPVSLVAAYDGHLSLSFWQAPSRDGDAVFAIVGFGEARRLEAHGVDRAQKVSRAGADLFRTLHREFVGGAESAPGPFVVGGLSFRPNVETGPWTAFADASFALPRWTYVRHGEKAWWWLCLEADDVLAENEDIYEAFVLLNAALTNNRVVRPDHSSTSVRQFDVADRDAYCALVADAIACIRTRATDKIVAVTSSHVAFDEPVDVRLVLSRLDQTYPDTTRFGIQRGEWTFVGASPERLVARLGRRVDCDGLAGTARRGVGVNDGTLVEGLLSSSKDRREHAFVVESIVAELGPLCSRLDVPDEPAVRTLRNVHHLWTPIRGVLQDELHVLDLVDRLHPTPAVAGTPRGRATAWIAEHEPVSRGWYTGAVGYFDAAGDGEFAVAIRAGLVGKTDAYLYAGAGIVEASDPRAEYAETRAKEAPMLAALGIAL